MSEATEQTAPAPPPAFQTELARLVAQFERNLSHYKSPAYDEASLHQEFLNPLFRALGWDVENAAGLIPQHREVEIESRTEIAGRQKRADYLFRTDRQDRFVCEAKKPAETLHDRYGLTAEEIEIVEGRAPDSRCPTPGGGEDERGRASDVGRPDSGPSAGSPR